MSLRKLALTAVQDAFDKHAREKTARTSAPPLWVPFPDSPQTMALHSSADEVFFGGAAGGGKTDTIIGLALTCHLRSIIFRREYPQLKGIIDRCNGIVGTRSRYNANAKGWRFPDGRFIELGHVQRELDVQKYMGRPHDFIGFDEITHFTRTQYRFLIGWNRTEVAGQRCRVISAGNPPTTPEGRWVVEEWAPWLDPEFPDPAEPGELRWYAMLDGKLTWLRSGETITHTSKETGKIEEIRPRSRTFIPSRIQDNPIYMQTGYMSVLQGMPEPLRSQMLYGDFTAGMEDDEWQVIPTDWVRKAQARWEATGGKRPDYPLTCVGVDPARGGDDKTVLAKRYGPWLAPLDKYPGKETPDGPAVTALVLKAIMDNPAAIVNMDIIGIGAAVFDTLRLHEPRVQNPVPVNFAKTIQRKDRTGVLRFINERACAYWSMREALDPDKGDNIMLPPDRELLADLCAARWSMGPGGIKVESKQEIIKRIGRSPDCGDACVLAFFQKARAIQVY